MTSPRANSQPSQAHGMEGHGGASDPRIKRSAWLLAAFAIVFYVGYIAFNFWHIAARP